ncbi:hypothetical protein MNBD_GAMMA12-3501 [hydrothermal vent metagenome]|uniref:Uncharacterized protein n=1 Tax=hydrothermal vent metagenome TaxID=652676 RepID=A0A3B0Z0L1_9ZZZZ
MNKTPTKLFAPFTIIAFLFAFVSTSAFSATPYKQAENFYDTCFLYGGKTADANGRHGCCLKGKCIICTGNGLRNCKIIKQKVKLTPPGKGNASNRAVAAPRAPLTGARSGRITLQSYCKRAPKAARCQKLKRNTNNIRK